MSVGGQDLGGAGGWGTTIRWQCMKNAAFYKDRLYQSTRDSACSLNHVTAGCLLARLFILLRQGFKHIMQLWMILTFGSCCPFGVLCDRWHSHAGFCWELNPGHVCHTLLTELPMQPSWDSLKQIISLTKIIQLTICQLCTLSNGMAQVNSAVTGQALVGLSSTLLQHQLPHGSCLSRCNARTGSRHPQAAVL